MRNAVVADHRVVLSDVRGGATVVDVAIPTWTEFCEWVAQPFPETIPKDSLPLWVPADLGIWRPCEMGDLIDDARVPHVPTAYRDGTADALRWLGEEGDDHWWCESETPLGYRNLEHVASVHMIAFDVDADPIPSLDLIEEAMLGRLAVVHSSSSATADAPRWRLAMAISRPVTAEEYYRIWMAVAATLPFGVGPQAKDPSRGWYAPRRGVDGSYTCRAFEGAWIDVDAVLKTAPPAPTISIPRTASADGPAIAPVAIDATHPEYEARLAWFVDRCRTCKPPTRGGETFAIAQLGTRKAELPADVVLRVLKEELRPRCADPVPLEEWHKVERLVQRTITHGRMATLPSDLAHLGSPWSTTSTPGSPATSTPPATSRVGRKVIFDGDDWIERPPPITYLVEGLLTRGCVGMIFGHGDTLKTWIVFSIGIAVAKGVPWLGRFPTTRGRVGIVDYETGTHNLRRRLHMLRAGACGGQLVKTSYPALRPNAKAFWDELDAEGFDLVIVDSLRQANPGADENNSAEAIIPISHAAEFSERTGCAVLFIHHAKKGDGGDGWPVERGSAAIAQQCDISYAARKIDVSPAHMRVEIRNEKPGDMRRPDPFAVDVVFDDAEGSAILSAASGDAPRGGRDLRREILDHLSRGPGGPKDKIARDLRRKKEIVRVEIGALVAEREIVCLPRVGYVRDTPAARRERVRTATAIPGLSTPAKLAKAAHVEEDEVLELIASGSLVRSGTGYRLF